MRIAQISFSLSGGFGPIRLLLFHGAVLTRVDVGCDIYDSFGCRKKPDCGNHESAETDPKPTLALLATQVAGTCKSTIWHSPEAVRS